MIDPAREDIWRLEVVDEIGSTSDAVADRARAGEPAGLALLARRQTAARGSRGRVWREPAVGNLAMTVLRRPDVPVAAATEAVFVAALAVIEALEEMVASGEQLRLKWPNDVLIERPDSVDAKPGKVAGILVETESDEDGRLAWLTIGIGANLQQAPAGVVGAASLLRSGAQAPDPVVVAGQVLGALARWECVAARDGFGAIRTAWLLRAHVPGTPIVVSTAGSLYRRGSFAGIDEGGALLLEENGSVERISTGAVLLPGLEGVPCCS